MNSSVKFLLGIILIISITSCNRKSNFTSETRKKFENWSLNLQKLQFYIDNDIVLSREISKDTAKIFYGTAIFQDGKYYQNIKLKANTKGVCTAIYPDRLHVSFEKSDSKYLVFAAPNSFSGDNAYQLINEDQNIKKGFINYDDNQYKLFVDKNWPKLMISKKMENKERYDGRTMKGRRVK